MLYTSWSFNAKLKNLYMRMAHVIGLVTSTLQMNWNRLYSTVLYLNVPIEALKLNLPGKQFLFDSANASWTMAQSYGAILVAFLMLICGVLQLVVVNLPTLAEIHVKVDLKTKKPLWIIHKLLLSLCLSSDDLDFYLKIDAFKVCHPITNTCGCELHLRFHYSIWTNPNVAYIFNFLST